MPNIKKLIAGDYVYVGEKRLIVTLVDPIQLFITTTDEDGITNEHRPWELSSSPPPKKEDRRPAKRMRKLEDGKSEGQEIKKMIDCMDYKDNGVTFYFKSVLREDRFLVCVGEFYRLNHLGMNAFLVTSMVGNKSKNFTVNLSLVVIVQGIVKESVSNFNLSWGIEQITSSVNIKKSSKVSGFLNNLVCESRSSL